MRRRAGLAILIGLVLLLAGATIFLLQVPRSGLLDYVLSTSVLRTVIIGCAVLALAWIAVVLRTYRLARPEQLDRGRRALGAVVVAVLCLAVITPFGYGAYLANSQRNLLNALFPNATSSNDTAALAKPRINIMLIGSDAGPDRVGTRTDTMLVASLDTHTGRTTLFSLPRNLESAPFPPGSPMAQQFPNGFNDLLNAVYTYGQENHQLAPAAPSGDPGINLLMSSAGYMLGLSLDYYVEINMQGFSSIIEALGGLDVDVGPNPIPMGGIGAFGGEVTPFGYIPAGHQHLNGEQALWYARSRTNASDYDRMGRQRCLLQYLVDQKSPIDVLRNFQAVATAATNSLSTNIPQDVLRALVAVSGDGAARQLESIAFDPNLPDLSTPDGHFNIGDPNFTYMRQVVRDVIEQRTGPTAPPSSSSTPTRPSPNARTSTAPQAAPAPTSLEASCRAA
jgi:LCP family protein required for cell wall assembly